MLVVRAVMQIPVDEDRAEIWIGDERRPPIVTGRCFDYYDAVFADTRYHGARCPAACGVRRQLIVHYQYAEPRLVIREFPHHLALSGRHQQASFVPHQLFAEGLSRPSGVTRFELAER